MASADGLILPKPAIPKTLGILNVIFAVLLILFGLCTGIMTLALPQIQQFGQKAIDQAKVQAEQRKATDLKTLDDREQTATTDEEKAAITRERAAVNARPLPITPDLGGSMNILNDPTVRTNAVAQVVTGLILHIILLVAGIGLIRLTPWGRTLTLWWAGLQIVQLLIFGVVNLVLILPITQKANEANMANLKKQLTGPNAPPNAEVTLQAAEMSSKLGPAMAIGSILVGMTYPIICLILLRTAGARAACLPPQPPFEQYPPPVTL